MSVHFGTKWLWFESHCCHLKLLCFLTFGFFSFLKLQHFIWPSTYPINSIFSVVVCIYKIHAFDEAFSLLAVLAMITEKMFFLFPWEPLLGKNLFIKSCNLSIQTIFEKKWNQIEKAYSRKIVTKVGEGVVNFAPCWFSLITQKR